ncbi:hypothetical protein F9278_06110 [Streptomyces phaeolivaceus]|uniref:DUF5667 domain-containing protein n=1 Tax=Streptomyces phaeolivaceus TaxID=2653200 RepID=A0A5P8JZ85_9ACTN|nr:DUF5667 domain-containing protein [Streptomyces phaeolivaceus]QFQ95818.1 hypothetical protein F9278_06110 [Streptomyces phaeolivaceus]
MTRETPEARPGTRPDALVADRLALAEAHLDTHLPLLTAEAQAAMLARVRRTAARPATAAARRSAGAAGSGDAAVPTVPTVATAARDGSDAVLSGAGAGTVLVLTPQRRAAALAQALEHPAGAPGQGSGTDSADAAPEQSRLVALADALRSLPHPALDPEVKAAQRARLVAAVERTHGETAAASRVPEQRTQPRPGRDFARGPRSRWARTLVVLGVALGVTAGTLTGVAAASTDALPGDSLYGVKRGIEDFRLTWADGDTERGEVYLGLAATRLHELDALTDRIARDNAQADLYTIELSSTLTDLDEDASAGRRLLVAVMSTGDSRDPVRVLSSFSDAHREEWGQVRDRLPAGLDDVAGRVTFTFDSIDEVTRPRPSPVPPILRSSPSHLPVLPGRFVDTGGAAHRPVGV